MILQSENSNNMRFIFFLLILFSNSILSQADLINAKKPSDIENKALNDVKSLEYTDIEENDILWSKVVYEYIDLNEKLNFPLLFPINDEQNKIGRKSLWRVLKEYIVNATTPSGVSSDKRLVGTDEHRKYVESMVPGSSYGFQFINKYRKRK